MSAADPVHAGRRRTSRQRWWGGCLMASWWVGLFCPGALALEPITVRSQSGQFVVRGLPTGAPQAGFSTSAVQYIRLDPSLTAVSLERIREAVMDELGPTGRWRGLITAFIQPVKADEGKVRITSVHFSDGWGYELTLPDRLDKHLFLQAVVEVILRELANRSASEREAELPAWLVDGLVEELEGTSLRTLALEPALPLNERARNLDFMRRARELLRRQPALKFDELGMPSDEQRFGSGAPLFRACAHVFVHGLLRLPSGRDKLRQMLLHLPDHLNWQTTFLHSFQEEFPRLIDADKWYALNAASLSNQDPDSFWPLETTWMQLDEILATRVQVRLAASELPTQTRVSLQRIISEWKFEQQQPELLQKINRLQVLRQRAAPVVVALLDEYARVLRNYVAGAGGGGSSVAARRRAATRARALSGGVRIQLDEADAHRAALREQTLKPAGKP